MVSVFVIVVTATNLRLPIIEYGDKDISLSMTFENVCLEDEKLRKT